MFADLCTERPPPTVLWELQGQGREEQSREAELGSQVLLPLLWECCWQLLLLPACPFLLPRMSELKNTPYTHMQGGLHRPCRAQDVAPELQPGNKLLYSTCQAARTCRVQFWLSGCQRGEGCLGLSVPPEPRRGWEEAHAAGVATGQDGGADKGAVLLPGPSPCSEAALPRLRKGLCHGAGGGCEPH